MTTCEQRPVSDRFQHGCGHLIWVSTVITMLNMVAAVAGGYVMGSHHEAAAYQ
jgi:hypothetical protein